MTTDQVVAQHYGREGLEQAILAALTAAGKDVTDLSPDDLAGIDEFHLGWRAQTVSLAERLGLGLDDHVLDIGAGIGGPARCFAARYGCRVVGIDLTPDFVDVAQALTQRCGLADLVSFYLGSALALPFGVGSFDVATLIHVGMNIEDKASLFAEARRVLKLGGRFGVYDVMFADEKVVLPYPMPWAISPETSFVETLAVYRRLLASAGFAIEAEANRRDPTLNLAREMRAQAAKSGPPSLGLHVIMGPAAKDRLRNVMDALEQGLIAPVEIIARAV